MGVRARVTDEENEIVSSDVKLFDVVEVNDQQNLPAGDFVSWLRDTRRALATQQGADVPCGECTACCRSSYFIHIKPEETETLAHIPDELLFAAPGQVEGNVVMGFDEHGCCPMLIEDKCSIYEHRPVTCRNYDCRIFPAAGISAGDKDKDLITQHVLRWKFDYSDKHASRQHSALRAAAEFLRAHTESFAGKVPGNSTQLAILAIKVHEVFLDFDNEQIDVAPSVAEIVTAVKEVRETGDSADAKASSR